MTSEERKEARYQRRRRERSLKKLARSFEYDSFEQVFSYENLYKAYKKCRCGVAWKGSVQKYITQAPLEVYRSWNRLQTGKWKSKGFYEFDIFERGKPRHIKSVTMEERVVQRCLCDNCLVPLLSPTFIYDNGASSKGKGYHFAIHRCEKHLRDHFRKHGTNGYILTFDFSKFFDDIDHSVIYGVVENCITDERLKAIIYHFVDAFGSIGLGLGSQISQVFALASANRLDHYVKEVLQVHGYARYMDDGYLISESKEFLQHCLARIRDMCKLLGIKINEKKTQIVKLTHGFTFLKCRFYLTESGKVVKKIYKKSVTKMRRKLKALRSKIDGYKLTHADVYAAFQSWRSYAQHFDAWHTIHNMGVLFNNLFIFNPCYP